jgi:predicted O-methyltransferase YrrM
MEKQIHPFLDERIEDYCQEFCSKEDERLKYIDRQTHIKFLRPNMLSGNWQGNLLKIISLLVKPQRVLEIGTFTSYATLCLAEGLQEGGIVHTIERDEGLEYFITETIERFNLSDKIKLHIGNALEVIDEIDGNFDLIFIDADKANYPTYFEKCVERLNSGGVLIADNILWYGKVVLDVKDSDKETNAIKNFNRMVTEDERLDNLIIPLRDGLMVARKK